MKNGFMSANDENSTSDAKEDEELEKLMTVAVSLYPGDSHAGLLRSRILDRRIYFLASAFVFGPCCKKRS